MRVALTLLIAALFTASCGTDFARDRFGGMSGGGVARAGRVAETEGLTTWRYNNWVDVGSDLTLTVDSVFARVRAGDKDIASAMQHVVRAGVDMLRSNYSIALSDPKVRPDASTRSFVIAEGRQPWNETRYAKPSGEPVLRIFHELPAGTPVRWRVQKLTCQLAFNSTAPRRIFVEADLAVQAEYRPSVDGAWVPASLSPVAINEFSEQLRRDMNRTYRRYLWDTLGLTVTTQQYGDGP